MVFEWSPDCQQAFVALKIVWLGHPLWRTQRMIFSFRCLSKPYRSNTLRINKKRTSYNHQFRLYGKKFFTSTHHLALQWLWVKPLEPHLFHYLHKLQTYDLEIEHWRNGNANSLSGRLCVSIECKYYQRQEDKDEQRLHIVTTRNCNDNSLERNNVMSKQKKEWDLELYGSSWRLETDCNSQELSNFPNEWKTTTIGIFTWDDLIIRKWNDEL